MNPPLFSLLKDLEFAKRYWNADIACKAFVLICDYMEIDNIE